MDQSKVVAAPWSLNALKEAVEEVKEEELTPNMYLELRQNKIAEAKSQGINPYPHKFHVDIGLPDYITKYSDIESGTSVDTDEARIAGRVHSIRRSGAKLVFYDIHGEGNGKYESLL